MDPNSPEDQSASSESPEEQLTEALMSDSEGQPALSLPETPPAEGAQPGVESPQKDSPDEILNAVAEPAPSERLADPLTVLADRALKSRLSPADEERTTALLKEALLEGRKGVERAVEQLPKLPWVVGVSGVTAAWPEMKTTFRARLIGGLAKTDTDATRRVRLSLARGLFKQDIPAATKLATGVAREMRDKETGAVQPKSAQIFANVLIGRAKPWVSQMVLADMKPADGDVLVHCAVMSVFGLPHAPATQLGVLKWAAADDRLEKLHPLALEAILKGVSRWSGKWQAVLRKEVAQLPEPISSALKAHGPSPAPLPPRQDPPLRAETVESEEDVELQDREEPAEVSEVTGDERPEPDLDEGDDADEDRDDAGDAKDEPGVRAGRNQESGGGQRQQSQPQRQRPVYESKTVPSQQFQQRRQPPPANFNLTETLKQIEAHVAALRSELHLTQSKLRQRDDELRKPRRGVPERGAVTIVHGEPTLEELARLNRQLEVRNAELQAHIQELAADSEDRAAAGGLSVPEAAIALDAQLRALLSLKLQEDFEDFAALEKEAPDLVVQQHYRTVLRHVFDVLRSEGVPFAGGSARQ